MRRNLEYLKEGLTKLLQEIIHSGDKVLYKNHDEDKNTTKFYFSDSISGLNTSNIPTLDMRNFDGKDMATWILHVDQLSDIHIVSHPQKVCISYLSLEQNQFVWY